MSSSFTAAGFVAVVLAFGVAIFGNFLKGRRKASFRCTSKEKGVMEGEERKLEIYIG